MIYTGSIPQPNLSKIHKKVFSIFFKTFIQMGVFGRVLTTFVDFNGISLIFVYMLSSLKDCTQFMAVLGQILADIH